MSQIFPNVSPILPPKDSIPPGYVLRVLDWTFPEERIGETVIINGQPVKKMLTLDINVPRDDFATAVNAYPAGSVAAHETFKREYPCPHSCPGCFNAAELSNPIMTLSEVLSVVDQAKELGLESIKFLGPGELLANPKLFDILDELGKRDLTALIFTKAAIMGNDDLARHYHGIGSEELTRRLATYPHTVFLVGARSFDPAKENRFIPQKRNEFNKRFDYHAARNRAVEQLCALGMNADLMRQRLELANAPVTKDNIADAFDMYVWGAGRNIPVVMPPTMVSGKGHRLVKSAADKKFENDYLDLAVKVYVYAINRGIMTHEQLLHEGAHPYIGIAPCNQLTHGLYINYDGQVWQCPGNDTPNFIVHPNVRTAPLVDIWMGSANYAINAYNNGCVKDGISLPLRFYSEVPERVALELRSS